MHRQFLTFVGLCALLAVPAAAQYTTASLGGTVLDASGAALPEAKVTVRNQDTNFTQNTLSDASGAFLFSRLPVGNYELQAEKAGFSTYLQSGIRLTVNQAATQQITMQVGQVTERVTVEANAELVDTRTATGGQLIDQRRVLDLPLNGRNAQTLVFLSAGTVDLTNRYCGVNCHGGVYPGEQVASVNGTGYGQVNYQLDGTDHNDTYINMNLPFPNPDSLQEFNLQSSNFSAEYGNAAGGIVNIVTRAGSNDFHGSAFEFLRNGAMNARNFFAPVHDALKRNQFGGSIGGPIRRNKLFFFGTYQGTRVRNTPSGRRTFVPTAAERTGDFSALNKPVTDPATGQPFPGNMIPGNRISPVSQYFLKWVPLPNGPGRELTFPGTPITQNDDQFMTRVDYNLTKHQLSGRYFFTNYNEPPVIPSANVIAAASNGNRVRVQNISFNHTFTWNPTLLFNSTFGLNRQRGGSLSSAPFGFPDAGIRIAAPTPPELSMSINGSFGLGTNHIGDFDRGDYTIREVATKISGGHEIKFGGEAVRLTNHIINTYQMAGSFSFNGQLTGEGLADFMIGRASSFTQGGGEFKDLKGTKWSLFVQDNIRVNQSLTVNLGLRWDPYFPYYDREGRAVCFQPGVQSVRYPNAPVGVTYGGTNHDPGCPQGGSKNNIWNLGPRLGFAYRLTQDGHTSLRGGAGLYYTPPQASQYNPFANIAPFAPTFTFNDVAFADPYGSVGIVNPFPAQYGPAVPGPEVKFTTPAGLRAVFDPNYRIPRIATWNLIIERQLQRDWLIRAAYQGNKGTFLYNNINREINPAIYGPGATVGNTQQRRFYQNFSNIGRAESGSNSHYQSMQLTAEKRFGHGLSILANYTWQKTIDDLGWVNPFNRRFDYAVSNDDVPQVFKFSNVWEAPRTHLKGVAGQLVNGWSVNTIMIWQSGFPLSVLSGRDNAFTGTGSQRADFLGGVAQLSNDRPRADQIRQWFDTSKFVANAPGTFGNSGRNNLRGPRFFNTDLSLLKYFRMSEQTALQFRGEAFNVFNNVVLNNPNTTVTSAQFGQINGAGSPRILQMALKVIF